MKSKIAVGVIFGLFIASVSFGDPNTQIRYEVSELGLGQWEYTYEVTNWNDSLIEEIEEFTIWFDYGLYDNLHVTTLEPLAGDWDEIVWQPEPVLEDDGAYDALASGSGIGVSESVYGFSVSFDWPGIGEPGSQYYEIINPVTFETIESGMTVPEPATMLLLGLGGVCLTRKKK